MSVFVRKHRRDLERSLLNGPVFLGPYRLTPKPSEPKPVVSVRYRNVSCLQKGKLTWFFEGERLNCHRVEIVDYHVRVEGSRVQSRDT